jgi:hypothetical protein
MRSVLVRTGRQKTVLCRAISPRKGPVIGPDGEELKFPAPAAD